MLYFVNERLIDYLIRVNPRCSAEELGEGVLSASHVFDRHLEHHSCLNGLLQALGRL